jgi:hypothetical protein
VHETLFTAAPRSYLCCQTWYKYPIVNGETGRLLTLAAMVVTVGSVTVLMTKGVALLSWGTRADVWLGVVTNW